jgi:1-acyl-sn-glycerol-3-phosphate acyltransferase
MAYTTSIRSKRVSTGTYDHQRYQLRRNILRFLIRWIGFTILVKQESVQGLENVPAQGPAILMINHIAFVDPIVVLHMLPRNIVPMAKVEVYTYPLIGIFPRIWGVIPVRREEFDRRAIQGALDVLAAGEIILVAPEAHRGPALKQAKEGIAYLARRANVPVIPVAIEGTEGFPTLPFTSRWRGPGAQVRFGKPFRFKSSGSRSEREELTIMTREAMYVLAALLPEHRRGAYADLAQATQETIDWL